ncbi:hypothetical protein NXT3_PA00200 (plasmid) [Sinorhizobium fredii]|uniref:Uncharacterized protein n=1 Tax=Rhizobium fredii TaxID=380 RepID=A0A2L0HAG4_RHIFR|nr:hypothetical protein NXT3_PA00200 [Sinorhizobium fredii]
MVNSVTLACPNERLLRASVFQRGYRWQRRVEKGNPEACMHRRLSKAAAASAVGRSSQVAVNQPFTFLIACQHGIRFGIAVLPVEDCAS